MTPARILALAALCLAGLCLAGLLAACSPAAGPAEPPRTLLTDLAWSFREPVPAGLEDFLRAVDAYGRELRMRPNPADLLRTLPATRLDVAYDIAVRKAPEAPRETVRKVVRVDGGGQPLSQGAVLYQLHKAVHADYASQDRHYFKGLRRLEIEFAPGVPAYEVMPDR